MKILFFHGWRSVPGGVKPSYLVQHGHEVFNPALPDEDFAGAVQIAQAEFDQHQPAVVVGSSRGGAVAMNIESGTARLVLLCPAWKKWGTAKVVKPGTVILHSRADDVVPFAHSVELVKNSGLPASALIEVGHDHRLADAESLEAMRNACDSTPDQLWMVHRQDDNGNHFVVQTGISRDEAERLVSELGARGHKQAYWASPQSFPTTDEVALP